MKAFEALERKQQRRKESVTETRDEKPVGSGLGGGGGGPPGIGRSGRLVNTGGEGPQEGAVLMVYGLNMDKMNAERVFNLLCLYGNVFKV